MKPLQDLLVREVNGFKKKIDKGPRAVLSSAIRFALNLALSHNKTLVSEMIGYTKLIEQLVAVL